MDDPKATPIHMADNADDEEMTSTNEYTLEDIEQSLDKEEVKTPQKRKILPPTVSFSGSDSDLSLSEEDSLENIEIKRKCLHSDTKESGDINIESDDSLEAETYAEQVRAKSAELQLQEQPETDFATANFSGDEHPIQKAKTKTVWFQDVSDAMLSLPHTSSSTEEEDYVDMLRSKPQTVRFISTPSLLENYGSDLAKMPIEEDSLEEKEEISDMTGLDNDFLDSKEQDDQYKISEAIHQEPHLEKLEEKDEKSDEDDDTEIIHGDDDANNETDENYIEYEETDEEEEEEEDDKEEQGKEKLKDVDDNYDDFKKTEERTIKNEMNNDILEETKKDFTEDNKDMEKDNDGDHLRSKSRKKPVTSIYTDESYEVEGGSGSESEDEARQLAEVLRKLKEGERERKHRKGTYYNDESHLLTTDIDLYESGDEDEWDIANKATEFQSLTTAEPDKEPPALPIIDEEEQDTESLETKDDLLGHFIESDQQFVPKETQETETKIGGFDKQSNFENSFSSEHFTNDLPKMFDLEEPFDRQQHTDSGAPLSSAEKFDVDTFDHSSKPLDNIEKSLLDIEQTDEQVRDNQQLLNFSEPLLLATNLPINDKQSAGIEQPLDTDQLLINFEGSWGDQQQVNYDRLLDLEPRLIDSNSNKDTLEHNQATEPENQFTDVDSENKNKLLLDFDHLVDSDQPININQKQSLAANLRSDSEERSDINPLPGVEEPNYDDDQNKLDSEEKLKHEIEKRQDTESGRSGSEEEDEKDSEKSEDHEQDILDSDEELKLKLEKLETEEDMVDSEEELKQELEKLQNDEGLELDYGQQIINEDFPDAGQPYKDTVDNMDMEDLYDSEDQEDTIINIEDEDMKERISLKDLENKDQDVIYEPEQEAKNVLSGIQRGNVEDGEGTTQEVFKPDQTNTDECDNTSPLDNVELAQLNEENKFEQKTNVQATQILDFNYHGETPDKSQSELFTEYGESGGLREDEEVIKSKDHKYSVAVVGNLAFETENQYTGDVDQHMESLLDNVEMEGDSDTENLESKVKESSSGMEISEMKYSEDKKKLHSSLDDVQTTELEDEQKNQEQVEEIILKESYHPLGEDDVKQMVDKDPSNHDSQDKTEKSSNEGDVYSDDDFDVTSDENEEDGYGADSGGESIATTEDNRVDAEGLIKNNNKCDEGNSDEQQLFEGAKNNDEVTLDEEKDKDPKDNAQSDGGAGGVVDNDVSNKGLQDGNKSPHGVWIDPQLLEASDDQGENKPESHESEIEIEDEIEEEIEEALSSENDDCTNVFSMDKKDDIPNILMENSKQPSKLDNNATDNMSTHSTDNPGPLTTEEDTEQYVSTVSGNVTEELTPKAEDNKYVYGLKDSFKEPELHNQDKLENLEGQDSEIATELSITRQGQIMDRRPASNLPIFAPHVRTMSGDVSDVKTDSIPMLSNSESNQDDTENDTNSDADTSDRMKEPKFKTSTIKSSKMILEDVHSSEESLGDTGEIKTIIFEKQNTESFEIQGWSSNTDEEQNSNRHDDDVEMMTDVRHNNEQIGSISEEEIVDERRLSVDSQAGYDDSSSSFTDERLHVPMNGTDQTSDQSFVEDDDKSSIVSDVMENLRPKTPGIIRSVRKESSESDEPISISPEYQLRIERPSSPTPPHSDCGLNNDEDKSSIISDIFLSPPATSHQPLIVCSSTIQTRSPSPSIGQRAGGLNNTRGGMQDTKNLTVTNSRRITNGWSGINMSCTARATNGNELIVANSNIGTGNVRSQHGNHMKIHKPKSKENGSLKKGIVIRKGGNGIDKRVNDTSLFQDDWSSSSSSEFLEKRQDSSSTPTTKSSTRGQYTADFRKNSFDRNLRPSRSLHYNYIIPRPASRNRLTPRFFQYTDRSRTWATEAARFYLHRHSQDGFDRCDATNQIQNNKRLEDSVLRDVQDYQVRGEDGRSSAKIPARIREIITKNLSYRTTPITSMAATQPNVTQLTEENRLLSQELNRVENLLSESAAERDELGIKYNALSERLELALKGGNVSEVGDAAKSVVQQNLELRRKLEEEHNSYKRKLRAYEDGQQRQAQLVQKLQAKLKEYKVKCQDLEKLIRTRDVDIHKTNIKLQSTTDSFIEKLENAESRYKYSESDHVMDLDSALIKLEEEQQRCASLTHVNNMLRDQLDQATATNQQLSADIQKLTMDWQRAREELESREAEWREEEKTFNEYFSSEHGRLLTLWREVVAFRRQFNEMKVATERDLSGVRSDVSKASRSVHSACLNLSANARNNDTQSQVAVDKERAEKISLESQLRDKLREMTEMQARYDAQSAELNSRVRELTSMNEKLRIQVDEKEKTISALQRSVSTTENRVSFDLNESDIIRHERQDNESLHSALRTLAESVINDDEEAEINGETSDLVVRTSYRARSTSPLRSRSPASRSPGRSMSPRARSRSPAFADATFSAVQTALSKRQVQVSELKNKLKSQIDQKTNLGRQLENVESEKRRLERQMMNMNEELDNLRREREDSSRDRDRIKNALTVSGSENSQLERLRQELNDQIEDLHKENEKLQSVNGGLQQQRDHLEEEKEDIQKDKERQIKENERCQRVIDQQDHKMSKIREELVNTKEMLNRALLEKEVSEGQKTEIGEALSSTELQKVEIEVEVNKLRTEEATLRDALLKMQNLNEGLGQDKIELNKIIMMLEADKANLIDERSLLEQEKHAISEVLVRVEQEKMHLETEKIGLNQNLELCDVNRQQLEDEISKLNRDRAALSEKLSLLNRQKDSFTEELLVSRKEIERVQILLERVTKEKEALTQDKGELVVQVTATERENRMNSESMSALVADKDGLEGQLYETQQQLMQVEVRKAQLEGENQELILRKEQLQAEINRLVNEKDADLERFEIQKNSLTTRLQQVERDLQMALQQQRQTHEEDVDRLTRERETQRMDFNNEREEIHHKYNLEKEELINRYTKEKEELQDKIMDIQRERDDSLLLAENEKQQALSMLEQEKCTLIERMTNLQTDIKAANIEYEKMKMEYDSRHEQDRSNINGLQAELKNFQVRFEETIEAHEREVKNLNNQIRDVARQREAAMKEVSELKTQLKLVEEARDAIRRDLIEANRKLREAEENTDIMRKDIMDLKRSVNDEIREKEAISQTAEELRNTVKRAEADKTELNRGLQDSRQRINVLEDQVQGLTKEASDLRANLRDVEKARLEARRELQELRRQIKLLDNEKTKLGKEVADLQARVAHDEEKDEESRRTSFDLKQKVVETEASREALRKELANMQRKMAELIDEAHLKEKNYQLLLEDSRRSESKLDDTRINLEGSLDNCNAEINDLRLKLSGSEGRVNALEGTLARLEGTKRDIEFKLNSIVSSLRRSIGFRQEVHRGRAKLRSRSSSPRRSRPTSPTKGFESTYATTTDGRGTPIPRTGSPSRAESPIRSRGASPVRFADVSANDVDPEAVRMALRDFMQQLANAERERDDAISQASSLSTQLKDLEGDRERTEIRLQQLQKSMCAVEEDKRGIDGRLSSAQTALMLQEETIRRNERERKTMSDKVMALERSLAAAESEKRQLEEKLSKLKNSECKLDDDRKSLKVSYDESESRCTRLELSRRALEGELQRVKLAMNDKETENQVLMDRVESLTRQIQDLETKSNSLQLTIDRMSISLTKTEEEGHQHKDKVKALSVSLSDSNAVINDLEDRIAQMQRAITNSEHDRRVLQERLEQNRQQLADAKKQNEVLAERMNSMQVEVSESEVRRAELEGQVRQGSNFLQQHQESEQELQQRIQKLQQEKQQLAEKVASLQRTISDMENKKHEVERSATRLEKDKSALKKTLDKVERDRLRSEELANKSVQERGSLDIVMQRLEDDNVELQRQVQQLQASLAEAEQQHSQRLIDLTTRHRSETEMETERIRQAQVQAERLLDARERSNRQRIKGLEEQCATYRDQLSHELRKRQQFLTKSTRKSEEIQDIRHVLDTSLTNLRDSSMNPILLEHESRKLDESMEIRSSPPVRLSRHSRSPARGPSPVRFPASSPGFRRSGRSPMSYRRSTHS